MIAQIVWDWSVRCFQSENVEIQKEILPKSNWMRIWLVECSLIYIFLSSGYSDTSKLSSSSLFLGTISVWIFQLWIFLKYVYVLNIPSYFLDILTSKVLLSILLPGASRQAKWSPYPLPDVLGWASADVGIFFLFSVLTALYFFTQPNINVNIYAQNIHVCFSYSCIYLSILGIISHTLCKNPILVC